jgi:predicted alpha/beta-fold hydrolase
MHLLGHSYTPSALRLIVANWRSFTKSIMSSTNVFNNTQVSDIMLAAARYAQDSFLPIHLIECFTMGGALLVMLLTMLEAECVYQQGLCSVGAVIALYLIL